MAWTFEKIAGPFDGPAGGLAWDGNGMLFSLLAEGRIRSQESRGGDERALACSAR